MTKYWLGTLLAITMTGCNSTVSWPQFAAPVPAVHHDWIAEMKSIARTHHMRYRIICMDWNSDADAQFAAYVYERELETSHLDEQHWIWGSGATQEEAAHDLMEDFNKSGFNPPEPPAEQEKNKKKCCAPDHKICPPEIRGDEYVEKP